MSAELFNAEETPKAHQYKPIGNGYCWICGLAFCEHPESHDAKWDDPRYWQGVQVGYCQGCGDAHVLLNKFCHICRPLGAHTDEN